MASKTKGVNVHVPETDPRDQIKRVRVHVIGGGVAGLTAAHELQERGIEVHVYEKNKRLGGKARSFNTFGTGGVIDGLPAEHGFRFFPSFYKHLTDTMSRIPYFEKGYPYRLRYVDENLTYTGHAALALHAKPFFRFPTRRTDTLRQFSGALTDMFSHPAVGIPPTEAAFAAYKLVNAMTMCQERREDELDRRSWWDYMHANDMSRQYRTVIVNGLTQNFVAMDAKNSSTKSVINILARLLNDFLRPDGTLDRVLNAPTNEAWFSYWKKYLEDPTLGNRLKKKEKPINTYMPSVTFVPAEVESLVFSSTDNKIEEIRLNAKNGKKTASVVLNKNPEILEYVIAAVPLEAMIRILNESDTLVQEVYAPSLANLYDDNLKTNWMTGIIYYLYDDESMDVGHVVYLESEWALTSISQNQFWAKRVAKRIDIAKRSDDEVAKPSDYKVSGILSVIISDFHEMSARINKTAQQTDNIHELAQETLAQIRDHLVGGMLTKIDWPNIAGFFVDPALQFGIKHPELMGLQTASGFATAKQKAEPSLREEAKKPLTEQVKKAKERSVKEVESICEQRKSEEVIGTKLGGILDLLKSDSDKGLEQYKKCIDEELADAAKNNKPPSPQLEADIQSLEKVEETEKWEGINVDIDKNIEPLFINTVNSWQLRPNAWTEIDNLFLASDYVKTSADLATMEGANEAARRAVNSLLDHLEKPVIDKITKVEDVSKRGRKLPRCSIFTFDEPAVFAPFRRFDKLMYDRGLPHSFSRPKIAARVGKRLQEWWDIA